MFSQFKIDAIFNLLIYNLTQKYENFIQLCREVGMVPIKCIPDVGQYSQLPPFENRECFSFESPNAHNVIFEVLGHTNIILQAGVNIYFEKTQAGVYEEVYNQGKKLLEDRFGSGVPEGTAQSPVISYGDDTLLGYISITTADYVGINLKIGNAKVWNKFYPIK